MLSCCQAVNMSILVVTDSRGRFLQSKLSDLLLQESRIYVRVIPGGTSQAAELCIAESVTQSGKIKILVIAIGICNLTKKIHDKESIRILYDLNDETRQTKIDILISSFNNIRNNPDCEKVLIATIPPVSLGKFFRAKNPGKPQPDFQLQQQTLLEDITLINKKITQINDSTGSPLIDWARYFYNSSVKRRRSGSVRTKVVKFTDTNLSDGIHFNDKVRENCHERLAKILLETHNSQQQQQQLRQKLPNLIITLDNDSSESEGEEEWDFKRLKSVCVIKSAEDGPTPPMSRN